MSAKYACITQHRGTFRVTLMCRVLSVSTSGYYAAVQRGPSAHAARDEQLLVAIRVAHRRSRRRYGGAADPEGARRRGHGGQSQAHCAVDAGRWAPGPSPAAVRADHWTTDSGHAEPIAPNTLAQQFAPATMGGPDRVFASDITYLRTRMGWLYLAVVLDLATRRVVGWRTSTSLGEELVLGALEQALTGRRPVVVRGLAGGTIRIGGVNTRAAPFARACRRTGDR